MDNNQRYKEMWDEGITFEDFWSEVEAFAEQNRLTTSYVEDEFILDGELIPIHLKWHEDEY